MIGGEGARRLLPAYTARVLVPVLLAKLATLASIAYFAFIYPAGFRHSSFIAVYRGNHGVLPSPPSADIVFRTWDAAHYLTLAMRGYGGGGPENAYYPLYPLLIRAFAPLTGGDYLAASLLVSLVLGTLGLLVLHHVLVLRHSERIANITLLLLCVQPAAFFTCLPYSESLFLLLSALFFLALSRERLVWAGVAGALLCLTRAVGILVIVPMALHAWSRPNRFASLLTCALPLLGWMSYFAIVALDTGDPWLGFSIQKQFIAAPDAARLFDPIGFLLTFAKVESLHGFKGSALDRVMFLWWFCAALALLKGKGRSRADYDTVAFAWLLGLVPAVTTALMSFTRYCSVIFPVHMKTAEWLAQRRVWLVGATLILAGLQLWLLARHVTHAWAG